MATLSILVIVHMTKANDQWLVYLNPATTKIIVQFREQLNNFVLNSLNSNGKTMYRGSKTNVEVSGLIDIPLNNVPKGIYTLKIESNKGIKTERS